jgi:hypothetical protein
MNLSFNNKKWMGTSEPWTTSAWFIFDYEDIKTINNLEELFNITIVEEKFNATINKATINPIVIESTNGTHRFKYGEATEDLWDVVEAMIKLDIFIWDTISWLIRMEQITLDN